MTARKLRFTILATFELTGSATVMAEPRYAWVINFRDCHHVALRGLTIGHTESGYCRGGVLRFEACTNVTLENCDLFGSGTYGLEFVSCRDVEVVDVKIRECTYGIVNLENVSAIVFRGCNFENNEGFELFQIYEPANNIMVRNCNFARNKIQGSIFYIGHVTHGINCYDNDSAFSDNTYADITNRPPFPGIAFNNNRFSNNVVVDTLWASSRRKS